MCLLNSIHIAEGGGEGRVNSVVKEPHFNGGSVGTETIEQWTAPSFIDQLAYIVNISQAE